MRDFEQGWMKNTAAYDLLSTVTKFDPCVFVCVCVLGEGGHDGGLSPKME